IPINKDVVRRILAAALPNGVGWWLSVLAHVLGPYEDSIWSADLTHLRCEYVSLRTYWGLVVMDQYTPHHRIWNSSRNRRWSGALPHVQSSDSRPEGSEIFKFRPRSVVSVSSMASQSKSARRKGESRPFPMFPYRIRSLSD